MLKNKVKILLLFFVSTSLNQETNQVDINLFSDDRFYQIVLHLEPFTINSYILNRYYPLAMIDYYDNGYWIDGSMNLPIYHLVSEKIYFDINSPGTITQLSYKQKKTDLYFDTKIASKLVRTFTDRHGYKDLCKDLLNKEISKIEQTSDWGNKNLTLAQQKYAAIDVLYLHQIKDKLDKILIRENRVKLANSCFDFIKTRTDLDLSGWEEQDIFKH